MKVDIITRTRESVENHYYCDKIEIYEDGNLRFSVRDSEEPEDNNLSRNFSDSYCVGTLLEHFYNIGLAGTHVEFKTIESDDI